MPIAVKCADCGQTKQVKDDLAGRTVRCSSCPGILFVPTPAKPRTPEVEGSDLDSDEEPKSHRRTRRRRDGCDDGEDYESREHRRDRRDERYERDDDKPQRRAKRRYDDDRSIRKKKKKQSSDPEINQTLMGAIGGMITAVVWFCRIFSVADSHYWAPIVLFVICLGVWIKEMLDRR